MTAIEQTTVVKPDGTISVKHPDFHSGEEVKVIVLLQTQKKESGRLKQGWAGALAEMKSNFDSVSLQHEALNWR